MGLVSLMSDRWLKKQAKGYSATSGKRLERRVR